MRTEIQRIKRVKAVLEPADPRFEVQTVMRAFFIVPEVIEVEYNDEAAAAVDFEVFKVTVTGTRYRRLVSGRDKEAGQDMTATFYPGNVSRFTGKMPVELHNFVRDLWWEK